MDQRSKQVDQSVRDAAHGSMLLRWGERGDDMHRRWFSAAAAITLRHIDAKIDSYRSR